VFGVELPAGPRGLGEQTIGLHGGPAVVVCISGSLEIRGSTSDLFVHRGQAAFVPAGGDLGLRGSGTAVVTTVGTGSGSD
jgi:mannose-6-phosphate isomerase class I